ncbi:MAG: restriction endonuclease subunit S [Bacteroidales bacterium]|nr:restriction endonuclease subunit S [Bacteroidales bacterium]
MTQNWERKKIKDICDKGSSNIAQNKITGCTGDYPVFGASGMIQNINFYHKDTPYIGVVKDGSGVGRVNIYPAYSSLLGTLQYITPKEGYSLQYVAYALKSLNLAQFASGAAIPHIYFKEWGESEIHVPALNVQNEIVDELDCLSNIINNKKKQLEELDKLAQSIFYDMFGDPIANEKGWDMKKVQEACSILGRIGFRGYTTKDLVSSPREGAISLSPTNITNGELNYSKCTYISWYKYEESPEIMINEGDILLVKTGSSYGKCALVRALPHKATINPQFVVLKNCNINNIYLTCLLQNTSAKREFDTFTIGAAIPTFSQKNLGNMNIAVPPMSLQHHFAEKIEAIEKQKKLIKKSLEEVETLFNSRMDYYFY